MGPDDRIRWATEHPRAGRAVVVGSLLLVPILVGLQIAAAVDRVEAWFGLVAVLVVLAVAVDAWGRRRLALLAVNVRQWDRSRGEAADPGTSTAWDPDRVMVANWRSQDRPGWWATRVDHDSRRVLVRSIVLLAVLTLVPGIVVAVVGEGVSRVTMPFISTTWLVVGADWIRRRSRVTRAALQRGHDDEVTP